MIADAILGQFLTGKNGQAVDINFPVLRLNLNYQTNLLLFLFIQGKCFLLFTLIFTLPLFHIKFHTNMDTHF